MRLNTLLEIKWEVFLVLDAIREDERIWERRGLSDYERVRNEQRAKVFVGKGRKLKSCRENEKMKK